MQPERRTILPPAPAPDRLGVHNSLVREHGCSMALAKHIREQLDKSTDGLHAAALASCLLQVPHAEAVEWARRFGYMEPVADPHSTPCAGGCGYPLNGRSNVAIMADGVFCQRCARDRGPL